MRQSWGDFLKCAGGQSHGVQVYEEATDLADSVAAYLAAGFERNQPGVLVARPEHMSLFADRLGSRGWEVDRAERAGLLVTADAAETLSKVVGRNGIERERFQSYAVRMLDRVQGGFDARPARVFGEMVDLLCDDGRPEVANELERLWNALAQKRRFSLLCGYRLDIFDPQTQSNSMPDICREHSHVLPASNYPRFARAVDSALREVLGPNHAATVYVLVSRELGPDQVPLAQSILMWVCDNLPTQSAQILASARTHYARPAA